MQAKIIHGTISTIDKLIKQSKEAYKEGSYRYDIRLHAVVLNMENKTAREIIILLKVHRANVSIWLYKYEQFGIDGLQDGQRPGRPAELSEKKLSEHSDIIESGPVAYGFTSGVWTTPMVYSIIEQEYDVSYSQFHVNRLLHRLGFSVQGPNRLFIQADPKARYIWIKDKYPYIKKSQN